MSRRIVVPLVAALLALSTLAPAVSAQGQPVFISTCYSHTSSVHSGTDILVGCGWGAKTRGLVQEFLKADVLSYTLTDASEKVVRAVDPAKAATYWKEPFMISASENGLECKPDGIWGSGWRYPLGVLPDGTYTLTVNEALTHPVNDALHTCTVDGEQYVPPPSLSPAGPFPVVVVTIRVVA